MSAVSIIMSGRVLLVLLLPALCFGRHCQWLPGPLCFSQSNFRRFLKYWLDLQAASVVQMQRQAGHHLGICHYVRGLPEYCASVVWQLKCYRKLQHVQHPC
jgi:hypothetical protein